MRNVSIVIRYEIQRMVTRVSFWLMAFLFPLIFFGISFGSQWLARSAMEDREKALNLVDLLSGVRTEAGAMGYVDQAGMIKQLPPGLPPELLREYPDRDAAQRALEAGEIESYYELPADVLMEGVIFQVQRRFSPLVHLVGDDLMKYVLTYQLVGDPDVAILLMRPVTAVETRVLQPSAAAAPSVGRPRGDASVLTMAVLFLFFFVLTMSSGYMLGSVTREKESRLVEVLLLSLRPTELMLGKLVGLGVVALLEMVIWFGGGWLVAGRASMLHQFVHVVTSVELPPGFLVWGVAYFLLGYLMYASALGALGALAPTARESSQFTFVLLLPLMIPLWLNSTFTEAPEGGVVTLLSMFPLTSPVSMMARMAAVPVPLWQRVLSLVLLVGTTYGLVRLAARFFRAEALLADHLPRLRDLVPWLSRHSG
ncbi:MAG TPA: ABC transporter permease [Chloroflexi bacterium]|nr:ABC transporter permease [Chloroflexota bacterium]